MKLNNNLMKKIRISGREVAVAVVCAAWLSVALAQEAPRCRGGGHGLRNIWGDALTDSLDCVGPDNVPYPRNAVTRMLRNAWGKNSRTGRSGMKTLGPAITQRMLMETYRLNNGDDEAMSHRTGRAADTSDGTQCRTSGAPARMCRTRYNTTAPMYGVSLTSGQPVTIVQKFPDLLQQVVFEVCESSECDVVHGSCTQTYVPYLFLVIPLGPVTLTGQDYVLVESGCVCKPKYSSKYGSDANVISAVP